MLLDVSTSVLFGINGLILAVDMPTNSKDNDKIKSIDAIPTLIFINLRLSLYQINNL